MKPLIFSHIPKTAGTSFRVALTHQFGNRKTLNDYGKDEPTTSKSVLRSIYVQNDFYQLIKKKPAAIIGHFPVRKYINLSSADRVIIFVREPSERVISEYKHHTRHANYTGSLLDFAKLPQNKNKMHRYLRGVPWSMLGFIGISERYDESLTLLNKRFNLAVTHDSLNKSPENQQVDVYSEQRSALKQLNHLDYRLYAGVLVSFEWRLKLSTGKESFAYGGWTFNNKDGVISGFAFYADSDEAVTVKVTIEDAQSVCIVANQFSDDTCRFQDIRSGYVGFSVSLGDVNIDAIECVVESSGQPIPHL